MTVKNTQSLCPDLEIGFTVVDLVNAGHDGVGRLERNPSCASNSKRCAAKQTNSSAARHGCRRGLLFSRASDSSLHNPHDERVKVLPESSTTELNKCYVPGVDPRASGSLARSTTQKLFFNKARGALCVICINFSLCFSAICIAQETGAEGAATETTRTLDDIRTELQKKQSEEPDMVQQGSMTGGGMGGMMGGMAGGMGGMGSMMGGMGGYGDGMTGGMGGMPTAELTEMQILAQIVQKVRARLKSPKFKRAEVEQQLRAALQQYFNADMEERITQFDKVKARVVDMEAKLQFRLESEGEIIDLQLKQMLHHADGLDFQVPGGTGAFGFPGGGMGMGAGPSNGGDGGFGGGDSYFGGGYGDSPGASASGGAGGESNGSIDPNSIGYDAAFGLTRVARFDPAALAADDPLKTYGARDDSFEFAEPKPDAEKMKAILLAFHQFHEGFHHLPSSSNRQFTNQPPHSWRVAILPLIGNAKLFNEYHFDQPWDSPQNLEVAKKMPELYRTSASNDETTSFVMLTGDGAFTSHGSPTRLHDITDGTSNTIAIVESDHEVPWTKPEDFSCSADGPLPELSSARLVGMVDGRVRQLPDLTDGVFRALITRAGGEVVDQELLGESR